MASAPSKAIGETILAKVNSQATVAKRDKEAANDAQAKAQQSEAQLQQLLTGAESAGFEFELDVETNRRELVTPRHGWLEDPGS